MAEIAYSTLSQHTHKTRFCVVAAERKRGLSEERKQLCHYVRISVVQLTCLGESTQVFQGLRARKEKHAAAAAVSTITQSRMVN